MHRPDKDQEHLKIPKVFGQDTPLFELFKQQHEMLTQLIHVVSEEVDNAAKGKLTALLSTYQREVEKITQQRSIDILNGRGEHAVLEAFLRKEKFVSSDEQMVDPYPVKSESHYPLLEGLIRDLIIPQSRSLMFSPLARRTLPSDITTAERGIYEIDTNGMVLILRPGEHIVRFHIDTKSHVKPITLERTTFGPAVYTRQSVELMINDFFNAIAQYECFQQSNKVLESVPVERQRFVDLLTTYLPAQFGGPIDAPQHSAFRGLCLPPMTSYDRALSYLMEVPAMLCMQHRPDQPLDDTLFLFRVDNYSFLTVNPRQEFTFHHYSEKERCWIKVDDYFPYVPAEQFELFIGEFFAHHGYEPVE